MLDIKLLRGSADIVRQGIKNRGGRYLPVLEELILKESRYRNLLGEVETLRAKSNGISSEIGKLRAQKAVAADALQQEAGALKEAMRAKEAELSEIKKDLDNLALGIPNIPDAGVKIGKSEADNTVVREDISFKREFNFKPLDHHDLGERLNILDFKTAAQLSGSRFALFKGAGAKLERALINFMLDYHTTRNGYTEILTPFLATAEALTGTGQLPKFEEELYRLTTDPAMYLIPTAEVTLTNMYRGCMLKEEQLPMKFAAYTACFRQEAGSYGKDTRGLIRNHQFDKVELVRIAKPEDSMSALEQLTADAESILKALKIPYRVVELCTADLGFSAAKTYDLEVWMPGENRFREISSCSNCMDFQARRMNTRFKRGKGGAPEFIHTLNGSGVAVGRTFAAVLENYQNEDFSITVPEALIPYFGSGKIISSQK